jgi:hypothetical protein
MACIICGEGREFVAKQKRQEAPWRRFLPEIHTLKLARWKKSHAGCLGD